MFCVRTFDMNKIFAIWFPWILFHWDITKKHQHIWFYWHNAYYPKRFLILLVHFLVFPPIYKWRLIIMKSRFDIIIDLTLWVVIHRPYLFFTFCSLWRHNELHISDQLHADMHFQVLYWPNFTSWRISMGGR